MTIEKISHTKIAEVLADAAATLRRVTSERDEALSKLAQIERQHAVEKLASQMYEKGLTDEPREHLIERLEKQAMEGGLARLQDAVDLVGPEMWSKFAQASDDQRHSAGLTPFENFLLGRSD